MDKYYVWLSLIEISNLTKYILLSKFNIKDLYYMKIQYKQLRKYLKKEEFEKINDKKYYNLTRNVLENSKAYNIQIVPYIDELYPDKLKYSYEPPLVIYMKGNVNVLKKKKLCIFTGKHINEYGYNILKYILSNIAIRDIAVVIRDVKVDKEIHKMYLENIIVLAKGINNIMTTENGIYISEYPFYVEQSRELLIARNRILAAFSDEIILIQCNKNDGAEYLVNYAIEVNTEISVIPGDIFDDKQTFTNNLIKEGANVVTKHTELLVYEQKNANNYM